ncbi:hypothetical protein D3C80_1672390 [compost metagenome]
MPGYLFSDFPQASFEKVIGPRMHDHGVSIWSSPLQQVFQRRHLVLFTMEQQAVLRYGNGRVIPAPWDIANGQSEQCDRSQ